MPRIFVNDKIIEVPEGENLRTALIANGNDISSPCGGCASCGQCVVEIKSGEDNLSEYTFEERQILGNVFHITKERLSCRTQVLGDIEVDISRHQQVADQKTNSKTIRRTKEERENKVMVERPPKEGGYRRPKAFRENKGKK